MSFLSLRQDANIFFVSLDKLGYLIKSFGCYWLNGTGLLDGAK